jgi:hypothetical protein
MQYQDAADVIERGYITQRIFVNSIVLNIEKKKNYSKM